MLKGQKMRRSDEGTRTPEQLRSHLPESPAEEADPSSPFTAARGRKRDIDFTVGRPEAEGAVRGGPRETSQERWGCSQPTTDPNQS